MAIKRFTGKYYLPDGTEKNIVASAFGVPTILNPNAVPGVFSVPVSNGNLSIVESTGNFYEPFDVEYFFNQSAQRKFSDCLKGGFDSLSAMAEVVKSKISSAITQSTTILSYYPTDDFNIASRRQALWFNAANGTVAPIVYFRCVFSHTINPGDLSENFGVTMVGGTRPAVWNESENRWDEYNPNNYDQEFVRLTTTGKWDEVLAGINDFFNSFDHIYAAPMIHPTVSGNETTGYASGFGYSGYMVYFSNTPSQVFTQYPKVIWSGQCVPWDFISWTGSGGDVEPTDPGTEPDPYEPIPPGPEPPGPGPDPIDPVDPPPMPDYPPIGATSVGFFKAFKPSAQQLQEIASKLWDPNAWDAIKQMFTNPMESIFGLGVVPVEPHAPTAEPVYLGRYNTQVSVPRIDRDFVTVDCGSVYIKKFFASYLDYDPYTKYSLYLPYIGEIDLNADEITAKTLSIKYHTNVITGDCVAFVLIDNKVIYSGNGNMVRQIPLSQTDYTSVIQTATQLATSLLAGAVAGAGAASIGSAIESSSIAESGELTGSGQIRLAGSVARQQSIGANLVSSTVGSVMGTKIGYKHAGRIGEGAGQISVQYPFITVTRPNLTLPEGHDSGPSSSLKRFTGYPVNKVGTLSEFHGLTIVEACQLNSQHATDGELAEALEIMKGGVII